MVTEWPPAYWGKMCLTLTYSLTCIPRILELLLRSKVDLFLTQGRMGYRKAVGLQKSLYSIQRYSSMYEDIIGMQVEVEYTRVTTNAE